MVVVPSREQWCETIDIIRETGLNRSVGGAKFLGRIRMATMLVARIAFRPFAHRLPSSFREGQAERIVDRADDLLILGTDVRKRNVEDLQIRVIIAPGQMIVGGLAEIECQRSPAVRSGSASA